MSSKTCYNICIELATKMRRGRPGGNPDLLKFQFQQKGDEPLNRSVTCRVTERQKKKLTKIQDWGDRFREWIDSIDIDSNEATATPTSSTASKQAG